MPILRMRKAEKERLEIDAKQYKEIKKLYQDSIGNLKEWENSLANKTNISSTLRKQYLNQLEKELMLEVENIQGKLDKTIQGNMLDVATAVVDGSNRILKDIGLQLDTAYSFVPKNVVQDLVTGKVYDGDWSLSKALWNTTHKTQHDIETIIAQGVLENKSSFEIAKDLEKYVNPAARKPWDWGKVYPGCARKVDYNAQRLARTLVSHAYQESFVRSTENNPFFEGYKWLTANNHRVCQICTGYAEDVHSDGLPAGVFDKGEVPLDHPNGQCTLAVYTETSPKSMAESLVKWAKGESNEELDKFAESLGYDPNQLFPQVSKTPVNRVFSKMSHDELRKLSKKNYYNYYGDDEIEEIVDSLYDDEKLSDAAVREIMNYSKAIWDEGYIQTPRSFHINQALRYGLDLKEYEDTVRALDKAISSQLVPKDITLNRFVDYKYLKKTFKSQDIEEISKNIGTVYENKQYLSTAVGSNPAFKGRPAIMRIQVEEGSHAFFTANYPEGEVILGRDTQYQLLDVIDHKNDPIVLKNRSGKEEEYTGIELLVRFIDSKK